MSRLNSVAVLSGSLSMPWPLSLKRFLPVPIAVASSVVKASSAANAGLSTGEMLIVVSTGAALLFAADRLDSTLADIRGVLEAEIFDTTLDRANEFRIGPGRLYLPSAAID